MRTLPLLAAIALVAAGCNRSEPPSPTPEGTEAANPATEQPAAPDVVVPPETPATTAPATVTMRYACGGNNAVEILSTDLARVTLADGRVVEVPLVAGSSPPAYVGEAVAFSVGNTGGQLSQEEGGHWDCKPA